MLCFLSTGKEFQECACARAFVPACVCVQRLSYLVKLRWALALSFDNRKKQSQHLKVKPSLVHPVQIQAALFWSEWRKILSRVFKDQRSLVAFGRNNI